MEDDMTRPLPEVWTRVLRSTELFAELEPILAHLSAGFVEKELAPGDVLMREGDDADSVYVVLDGKLDAYLERDERAVLNQLGPGSIVGEVALLVGGKRSATVRAVEPTRVLEL